MTRLALLGPLLLLASCSHDAPAGAPPRADIKLVDMQLASFKQQFNDAPGARVVVMLSPT